MIQVGLLEPEEFFVDAQDSTLVEDTKRSLVTKDESKGVLDVDRLHELQDWNRIQNPD